MLQKSKMYRPVLQKVNRNNMTVCFLKPFQDGYSKFVPFTMNSMFMGNLVQKY